MSLKDLADYTINPAWPLSAEQQDGARHLLSRRVDILNFQAGLGKTYTSLTSAVQVLRYRPGMFYIVILCPAKANKVFKKEITEKLGYSYRLHQATGVEGPINAEIQIFNFSSMHKYIAEIENLSKTRKIVSIIDEAHTLQSRGTQQYEIFTQIRPFFAIIWALTATPLMSLTHIKGLYFLVDYLDPGFFGSWATFKSRYLEWELVPIKKGSRQKREEIIAIKDVSRLREDLSKILIIRSIKYDIRYHYHTAPLTEEEMSFYRQAGKGVLLGNERKDFTSRMHDLQRIVDGSHESVPSEISGKLSSKDKLFLKKLKEVLNEGLSAIIYTEYYDTIDRLTRVIKAVTKSGYIKPRNLLFITGKESDEEREKVEEVLGPGDLVLITKAGAESRNLQKSNQVMVYNSPYGIGALIQLVGRVARMDSLFDHQDIHIFEAEGTIDTYRRLLVQDNAWVYNELFGEQSSLPDVNKLDRTAMADIRRKLLWGFSGKKKAMTFE